MNKDLEKIKSHRVHKSNNLIEAKFKLPLITQRILAICISKINPRKNKLQNPYRFNLDEYCELSESNSKGIHEKLRDALYDLRKRNIHKYDPDLGRERVYGWVTHIDVWDSSSYDIYFHPELELDLLAKSKYTSYFLGASFRLSSKYSLRLYEIAKKWEAAGKAIIPVDKLRLMLGLDPSEYPLYADFKKRCLKKAVDEINKKSEILISFNQFKKGRKVDLIELMVKKSKGKPPALHEVKKEEKVKKDSSELNLFDLMDEDETDQLINKLMLIQIQPRITLKLIEEFGIEVINNAYEQAINDRNRGKIKSGVKLSGVVINKIKEIKLSIEVGESKKRSEKKEEDQVKSNKMWLEGREKETDTKLIRYEKSGVWREIPDKKVILFKNVDFIKSVSRTFGLAT